MRSSAAIAIFAALPLLSAQSSLAPDVLLLSRIRHRAAADLSHLPNFTCLETIERSSRRSGLKPFQIQDTVRVEVAYVGTRELFAWPGASNFESRQLSDMIGSGLTSSGEFIGHARAVFVNTMAVIHYVDQEDMGGHRAAHFDYEISPAFSGYEVSANGGNAVVGSRGSFWADTSSFDLLRLTVEGTDIPIQLGIRAMLTSVDYRRLRIGSDDYLLPQSAVIWMGHESGIENRNRVEFTHCRQYATESVLSFDEGPESDHRAPQPPAAEFTVPPGLNVSLHLETPIRLGSVKIGDTVSATLSADIKQNDQEIAPKGATVSGRVRLLRKDGNRYVAGLEFTDLTFDNKHARFIARLISADSRYAQLGDTSTSVTERPLTTGTLRTRSVQTDLPPELPGVATFFIPSGVTELPKGMLMVWKTGALTK